MAENIIMKVISIMAIKAYAINNGEIWLNNNNEISNQ